MTVVGARIFPHIELYVHVRQGPAIYNIDGSPGKLLEQLSINGVAQGSFAAHGR